MSPEILDDVVRHPFLTLWNVYAFFVTYANVEGFDPDTTAPAAPQRRPQLDRWVLSQLAGTVAEVRERMDDYDATAAGRRIQTFVDDLSNWYVRRSRRRFWHPVGHDDEDTASAFHTLHECLVTLAALLAPFTPFVADALWRNLAAGRSGRPSSVHLLDFPQPDATAVDPALDDGMVLVRRAVELGRRVRTDTKTRTRQPLQEAVLHLPQRRGELEGLFDLVADELNVKHVRLADSAEAFGRWRAKPDFKVLGPRLGTHVQAVARALSEDDGALAAQLAHGGSVELVVDDGSQVTLRPDDVEVSQDPMEGWGVASESGVTVALELGLTPELRSEGLAREIVRVVQDARKAAGLAVSDRIVLRLALDHDLTAAFEAHRDTIAGETLATEITVGPVEDGEQFAFRQEASADGRSLEVALRRV
jgi:isoleucyl-tRNA synthetase